MQYLVFDDMTQATWQDVERMLPQVAEHRRQRAMQYKHLFGTWATLKSYTMLAEMVDADVLRQPWTYNAHGKPLLADGPYFSISHCKNAIAVAVDTQPIGIDVETIRPYNDSLAQRVMNAQEMKLIDVTPKALDVAALDSRAVAFTTLWTQKEAVLKLRGTGIIDDLKQVLVDAPETLTTWVNEEKGYCLTLAQTK